MAKRLPASCPQDPGRAAERTATSHVCPEHGPVSCAGQASPSLPYTKPAPTNTAALVGLCHAHELKGRWGFNHLQEMEVLILSTVLLTLGQTDFNDHQGRKTKVTLHFRRETPRRRPRAAGCCMERGKGLESAS